jgi:radical SAM-linked protein
MTGEKIRFRFRKDGPLRFIGHHDLMRCCERMLRRGAIPFKSTAGFHPTPRFIFALSLPLGVVGLREVVELELTEPVDVPSIHARLTEQAVPGLQFTSAMAVPLKAGAVPRRVEYVVPVPPDRRSATQTRIDEVMSQSEVWVDRYKPRPRQVNIRPFFRGLHLRDGELTLDLWVTGTGTARVDETLTLLGLDELRTDGTPLTRAELELHDEHPAGSTDGPPTEPTQTRPLTHPAAIPADDDEPTATWGLSPHGPSVE